jgi:hypothetical protein
MTRLEEVKAVVVGLGSWSVRASRSTLYHYLTPCSEKRNSDGNC